MLDQKQFTTRLFLPSALELLGLSALLKGTAMEAGNGTHSFSSYCLLVQFLSYFSPTAHICYICVTNWAQDVHVCSICSYTARGISYLQLNSYIGTGRKHSAAYTSIKWSHLQLYYCSSLAQQDLISLVRDNWMIHWYRKTTFAVLLLLTDTGWSCLQHNC